MAKLTLRDTMPSARMLDNVGIKVTRGIRKSDIEGLQIQFLEGLYELWPYTLEKHYIIKECKDNPTLRNEKIAAIMVKQKPHIKYLKDIAYCIAYIRLVINWSSDEFKQTNRALREHAKQNQYDEYQRCKEDVNYFINYWCWLVEPRLPEIGLNAYIPFVMYPQQAEILGDIHTAYITSTGLLIEKSRETGISWLACAYAVWHWLFTNGYSALFSSEKESKIDLIGSRKSLFGKIRFLIYTLPYWMVPPTYADLKNGSALYNGENDNYMKIINPVTGAEITGETGANIGRGARASMVFIDEEQNITTPELMESGCESVTNCRIDIGTPLGMNHFAVRRFSGNVAVSTINWFQDPRKTLKWDQMVPDEDSFWKKYKDVTITPVLFAQEHGLDYAASTEDAIIEAQWVRTAINFAVPADGPKTAGLDVAAGGKNKSVYVHRVGPQVYQKKIIDFIPGAESALVMEAIDLGRQDDIDFLNYDRDGIGISVPAVTQMMDTPPPFKMFGIKNASRASDWLIPEEENKKASDVYVNKRAEVWYNLQKRFRKTFETKNAIHIWPLAECISIPNDNDLVMQLSQPKKKWRGPRKGVESKHDMKERGIESPDIADALAFAFLETGEPQQVIDQFDYTSRKKHYIKFKVEPLDMATEQYVSIWQTPDLATAAIGAIWYNRQQKLKIYWEYFADNAQPQDLVDNAKFMMQNDVNPIKEWICNDEMITGIKEGRECPWYHYKKAGVMLRQNFSIDPTGAIMTANYMFDHNQIQVKDPDCEGLMFQLYNWTKQKSGKPEKNLGYVLALCQMITRLKYKKIILRKKAEIVGYNMQKRYDVKDEIIVK